MSASGHDAAELELVLLAMIPILLLPAVFVSPYLRLVLLFGLLLWHALRL